MTIAPGDRLPDATLIEPVPDALAPVTVAQLTRGRRIVLFGVPGAFTGTCTGKHVPSFIRAADGLRAKGIEDIGCVSVNDPHVMRAWGASTGATAAGIRMLADPASELTRALGLAFDNPAAGMYGRIRRCSMLVEDGVVRVLNIEEKPGVCELTSGDSLLASL